MQKESELETINNTMLQLVTKDCWKFKEMNKMPFAVAVVTSLIETDGVKTTSQK